jgi:DNA-binding Xre family transcriptional regulator
MALVNRIKEFAEQQQVATPKEFAEVTKIPTSTACRLFKNPNNYPSKESQELICRAFGVQPGDFLKWEAKS